MCGSYVISFEYEVPLLISGHAKTCLNSGYDTKIIKAQIQETHNFCPWKDMGASGCDFFLN